MNLVEDLVALAEDRYAIDWPAVQAAVIKRLSPARPIASGVLDVRAVPTYWCVPLLVGDYVGATRTAVVDDLESFVAGCLVRHFMYEPGSPLDGHRDDEIVRLVTSSYGAGKLTGLPSSFEARFAAKCRPWTILLTTGTQAILDETHLRPEYDEALGAIVLVYSCLQMIDDWHDRADDAARGHWNVWDDERPTRTLRIIEPLVTGARAAVERLRPHLLRRALASQLGDTILELAEVVALHPRHSPGPVARRRDGPKNGPPGAAALDIAIARGMAFLDQHLASAPAGLWLDFERPGVSRGSTECVSAFVAEQLAHVPEGRGAARGVAARLLEQPHPAGGWGYREDVPADCDSTAWVLLAAVAAGVPIPAALLTGSQRFVIDHQRRDGGFVTYSATDRASLTPGGQAGWFAPDVSVTASAVLALIATRATERRRVVAACRNIASSPDHGRWASYWWAGSSYATFVAARALGAAGGGRFNDVISTAEHHLLADCHADGGWTDGRGGASEPFATSLALRTLLLRPGAVAPQLVNGAVEFLVDAQHSSGAWPPSARMLAPGAGENGDLLLADNGVVTTASVVAALHAAREWQTATRP